MNSLLRATFPLFVPALLTIAGCTGKPVAAPADPAAVAKFRQQFTLEEEPDGVQTVSEVRTALSGEAPPNVLALLEEEGEEHDHANHADAEAEHADHDNEAADDADVELEAGDNAEADRPESMDVAIVGVVGGVPNPMDQTVTEFPFSAGQAMFFLADPEAVAELEEHGHQHATGEECVFCEAHAADARELIAAVNFTDENGKPIKIDARELFELKEHEVVVVRGTAKLDSGGILTVNATGLYVRR